MIDTWFNFIEPRHFDSFCFDARGNFASFLRPSAELDFESGGASKPDGCEVQLCKTSFMEVLKDETPPVHPEIVPPLNAGKIVSGQTTEWIVNRQSQKAIKTEWDMHGYAYHGWQMAGFVEQT